MCKRKATAAATDAASRSATEDTTKEFIAG